jgi:serine/threonine-protein kinase
VSDTGVVKVMDFGIARMMGAEHYTHAGYMMGTPAYMAPEQVLGKDIDRRADLYSVGVLFYRLLTRELPFQADTAIAMAQKQVAEVPTPLGTFRADLPPWCEAIIGKALAKSPDARFQTAEEFRAAILAAVRPVTLGELPTMATPTASSLLRTADVTGPYASGPRPAPPAAASGTAPTPSVERTGTTVVLGRGHLFALAALLAVLVLGIGALGVAVLKRGAGAPQLTTSPPAEPPAAVVPAPPEPDSGPDQQQPPAPAAPDARVTPPAPRAAATTTPKVPAAATETTPPPKPKESTGRGDGAPAEPAPPPVTPAAAPVLPPLTFKDVKMLVPAGKSRREREAVLTLAGDHLSLRDKSTQAELLSLPYSSITQSFYSLSKQPKWKGPDGKDVSVSVDLGKMGFFRSDRNWVIFTTQAEPVFICFENRELRAAVRAIEERTGVKIRR